MCISAEINLSNPLITLCTTIFSKFCSHSTFACSVWTSEQRVSNVYPALLYLIVFSNQKGTRLLSCTGLGVN